MLCKVLLKSGRGHPVLQPLLPAGCWVTIPAPHTGEDPLVGCRQGCERAKSTLIVRVVVADAVAGIKQKKEIPLKNPLQLGLCIFSFCRGRIPVCLKYTWPTICQGKYLKKAASRLLSCCNLAFKEN